ncbi:MAG: tRNA-guanine transglycosylase [bacterium]
MAVSFRVISRNTNTALNRWRCCAANCGCETCRGFTRAYLRHLFVAGEALGPRLLTAHNTRFFQDLMAGIRDAIARGEFEAWAAAFLDRYQSAETVEIQS